MFLSVCVFGFLLTLFRSLGPAYTLSDTHADTGAGRGAETGAGTGRGAEADTGAMTGMDVGACRDTDSCVDACYRRKQIR